MSQTMKISLDGGLTWIVAPEGVRVSIGDIDVPGEDKVGQLDFNLTSEGIVTDVWVSRESDLDHNIATRSEEFVDLMSDMIESDA